MVLIRTLLYVIVLTCSVLWLPWWTSLALFVVGAIALRYAIVLLVPAVLADILYAPHTVHSIPSFFYNHATVFIVVLLVGVRFAILAKTRVSLL
jgi:hypothetical protein